MPFSRHCIRAALSLSAAQLLAGCITAPPVQDPQAAALAEAINGETGRYFAGLAATAEPECDYEHNMNIYSHFSGIASQLEVRLAGRQAGAALIRAGNALSRTIEHARVSHELASARTDDTNGACMAPHSTIFCTRWDCMLLLSGDQSQWRD